MKVGIVIVASLLTLLSISAIASESIINQLAHKGNAQQIKDYLQKNKQLTKRQLDDAMFRAIYNRDNEVIKSLLASGANPNAEVDPNNPESIFGGEQDDDGYWGPIQIACHNSYWDKVAILLLSGANPMNTMEGEPVAFCIVRNGNDKAVETLIKTGKIKKSFKNDNEETLFDCAKENKALSDRIRKMLR